MNTLFRPWSETKSCPSATNSFALEKRIEFPANTDTTLLAESIILTEEDAMLSTPARLRKLDAPKNRFTSD